MLALRRSVSIALVLLVAAVVVSCGGPPGAELDPPELDQTQVAVVIDPLVAPSGVETLRVESTAGSTRLAAASSVPIHLSPGMRSVWLIDEDDEPIAIVAVFVGIDDEAQVDARASDGVERSVTTALVPCSTRVDLTIDALAQALYLVTLSPDVVGLRCSHYRRFEAALLADAGFNQFVGELEDGLRAGLTGAQLIDPDLYPQRYDLAALIRARVFAATGMDLGQVTVPDADKPRSEPARQGVYPVGRVNDWTRPYDVQAYNGARLHYELAHVAPQHDGRLDVLRRESLGPVPLWRFWDDTTRVRLRLADGGAQSVVLLSGWEDVRTTPDELIPASTAARLKNAALVVKDIASLLDVGCLANASDAALETWLASGSILADLEAILVDFGNQEWTRAWDRVWGWFVDSVMSEALKASGLSNLKCTANDGKLLKRGNKYVYAVFKGLDIANTAATLWSLYSFHEPYASWDVYVGPEVVGSVRNASATLQHGDLRIQARVDDGFPIAAVDMWVLDLNDGLRQLAKIEAYDSTFSRAPRFTGRPWLPAFVRDIDVRVDATGWAIDHAEPGDVVVLVCATAPSYVSRPLEDCPRVTVTSAGVEPHPEPDPDHDPDPDPDVGPAPGALSIDVVGLPAGLSADIVVTGPDGFSRALTSATTLTVPAGTYTISASGVSSGGTTYAPTPSSQQRTVSSDAASSATVTYAVSAVSPGTLAITVTGLPSGVDADITVSGPDGFAATLLGSQALTVAPGDYLISASVITVSGTTYSPTPASQQVTVASTATRSLDVTYTVTSVAPGALSVSVTGLPTGVMADIVVTGPDGYQRTVTESITLTLPPGTYTVSASALTSGRTTYSPTPASQQRTVASSATAAASVAYAATLVPLDVWFSIGARGSVRVGDQSPCTSDCTRYVTPGQAVSIVATPDSGYVFSSWADACSHAGSSTTCTLTPTAATRVVANFAQETINIAYTRQGTGSGSVTATYEGAQHTCSSNCTIGPVGVPTVAIVQATAASGSAFAGWGGACAAAGTNALCTLDLRPGDGNQSISARFDTVTPRGDLAVTVRNWTNATRSQAVVVLYSGGSFNSFHSERTTNSNGVATFTGLPAGTYSAEVYYTPSGGSPRRTEFWGGWQNIVVHADTSNTRTVTRSTPYFNMSPNHATSVAQNTPWTAQRSVVNSGGVAVRLALSFDRSDCTVAGCSVNGPSTTGTSLSASLTPTGSGTYRVYYALMAFLNGAWLTVDQTNGYEFSFTSVAPTASLTVNVWNVSSYWPPTGVTVQLCRDSFMTDCIASRSTGGSSQSVTFTGVPHGTYHYRVTSTPSFTPRVTELWGDQLVSVTGNTTSTFTRNMPYIDSMTLSCVDRRLYVRTRNPGGGNRSVYVSAYVDRSRSAPYDSEPRNANHIVGPGSMVTSEVAIVPTAGSGTYYLYVWLSDNQHRALDQIPPWTLSCQF